MESYSTIGRNIKEKPLMGQHEGLLRSLGEVNERMLTSKYVVRSCFSIKPPLVGWWLIVFERQNLSDCLYFLLSQSDIFLAANALTKSI